jgi:hypothetical protein
MFTTLYRHPRTFARHENGPLHQSRQRSLEPLAAQGAALHTLRGAQPDPLPRRDMDETG